MPTLGQYLTQCFYCGVLKEQLVFINFSFCVDSCSPCGRKIMSMAISYNEDLDLAGERKTQCTFNTTAVCRMHSDEVIYLLVAVGLITAR